MQNENRRSFLKQAGTFLAAGSFLNLNPSARGANEKIVLALIGGNNRGRDDALSAIKDGAVIKTFCDIDDAVLHRTGGSAPNSSATSDSIPKPRTSAATTRRMRCSPRNTGRPTPCRRCRRPDVTCSRDLN